MSATQKPVLYGNPGSCGWGSHSSCFSFADFLALLSSGVTGRPMRSPISTRKKRAVIRRTAPVSSLKVTLPLFIPAPFYWRA